MSTFDEKYETFMGPIKQKIDELHRLCDDTGIGFLAVTTLKEEDGVHRNLACCINHESTMRMRLAEAMLDASEELIDGIGGLQEFLLRYTLTEVAKKAQEAGTHFH